jgi:hypothetical protein
MNRHTITYVMLVSFLVAIHCSRSVVSNKVIIPTSPLQSSKSSEASFKEVKSRWTVVLGSQARGMGPMMMPFLSGGGPPSDGGFFPMTVTATLMDRQVIEAGLDYYQDMTKMTPEEAEHFRRAYEDHHETDNYILIEASFRTTATESYLDLSQWTIFLEDDRGNQHVPDKVVEMSPSTTRFGGMMDMSGLKRPMPLDLTTHMKNIFLYFPIKDYYGNATIYEGIKYLKLVFLQNVGGSARAEGFWQFQSME